MSTVLPPVPSDKALAAALDGFVAALGSAAVLTSEAELAEFRDPFAHATWDAYTASAVVMPTTVEEIQAVLRVANEQKVPLWTHSQGRNNGYGGPAPRVRGSVIVSLRNMNRVLEIDERVRVRRRRAGRALVRPLRRDPRRRPQAVAVDRRSRLGQRDRQHARPRSDLPPVRPGHGGAVRHGGRARQRRRAAHRHGRDARQQVVAPLQARPRADARPAVHAVQLRDRHEDGRLADAAAPDVHAVLGAGVEGGRPRAGRRHAAHAPARRHDRRRAVALQHALPRLGALEPLAVVRRRGADPGSGHRSHRTRARDRPLDHPLGAVGRRGGRRPPLREDQGGLRADPGRRGVGDEARPETAATLSTPPI